MAMSSINGHFWELNNGEEKQKYVCNDCGYEWEEESACQCPKCGSSNIDFLFLKQAVDEILKNTFLFDVDTLF